MEKDKIKDKIKEQPKNFRDLGSTTLFRITNFELFVKVGYAI